MIRNSQINTGAIFAYSFLGTHATFMINIHSLTLEVSSFYNFVLKRGIYLFIVVIFAIYIFGTLSKGQLILKCLFGVSKK